MNINRIMEDRSLTRYQLAKASGIPYTTLCDICNGKTRIGKCSAETVYRLSKAIQIPMEQLLEGANLSVNDLQGVQKSRERSYEYGLPDYLQRDLDAYKEGLRTGSTLLDCLWGELYGSINMAEISDGTITSEHADYLRKKYLWTYADGGNN